MSDYSFGTPQDSVDLSSLDQAYESAEVPENEELPDGRFQTVIERVEITRAQSTGNAMLKWSFRVLGPTHQGRMLWKNSVLIPSTMEYLKADLQRCGLTLQKLSELPSHLGDLLDLKLEVVKRSKDGNSNVYINKRIVVNDEPSGYRRTASDAMTPF